MLNIVPIYVESAVEESTLIYETIFEVSSLEEFPETPSKVLITEADKSIRSC